MKESFISKVEFHICSHVQRIQYLYPLIQCLIKARAQAPL